MKQFKRDESQNSNKLNLDKYYTSEEVAQHCIDVSKEILKNEKITEIVEPSAGNGVFSKKIKKCIAYDIEPEGENIIKQDFLKLDILYKQGRLFIGNPPFGSKGHLMIQFYKKIIKIGDYIAFILPISQLNNNHEMYEFDLIYSEDLGKKKYTDRAIHCCFNIYKRPINGLNKRKTENFKDFKLMQKLANRNQFFPDKNYDFRICAWGSSCGKILSDNEDYVNEICFYIYNKDMKEKIFEAIKNINVKEEFNITSTPCLHFWQLNKYLKKMIPELK